MSSELYAKAIQVSFESDSDSDSSRARDELEHLAALYFASKQLERKKMSSSIILFGF